MKKLYLLVIVTFFYVSCSSFEIRKNIVNRNLGHEIKILQISDLHINKEKQIYNELVSNINSIKPDILLLTGDSIDKRDKIPLLNNFLHDLDRDINKFSVLGNWEHWSQLDINKLKGIYLKNGVELLINEGREIVVKDMRVYIYGTDDLTGGRPNLDNFNSDNNLIHIIMTHSPKYFDYIVEEFPENNLLVFSGHTHGGQITFLGKPIFVPQGSGDYLKGIYTVGNKKLYVSKGIGNSQYDIRLFAKPDIFEVIIK